MSEAPGQIFAFLIASPWNSLSTTHSYKPDWHQVDSLLLASPQLSALPPDSSQKLARTGLLAANPNQKDLPAGFRFWSAAREHYQKAAFDRAFFSSIPSGQ